jgi:hypothetical protein
VGSLETLVARTRFLNIASPTLPVPHAVSATSLSGFSPRVCSVRAIMVLVAAGGFQRGDVVQRPGEITFGTLRSAGDHLCHSFRCPDSEVGSPPWAIAASRAAKKVGRQDRHAAPATIGCPRGSLRG